MKNSGYYEKITGTLQRPFHEKHLPTGLFNTGIGIKPKTAIEDIVRIDNEDKEDKGIHFNAKYIDKFGARKTFAASIAGTSDKTENGRKKIYDKYVEKLQGKTAQKIWEAWSSGNAPGP